MENPYTTPQLIDQHKQFHNEALSSVIATLGNCNKDYFTIAIIGAQNTGKSTLLNHLFRTNFKVLKGEAGTRTTRGVILGRDYNEKLIIMDVEGNDSYETHIQGDENYEKMVSSFALVGANVLLVNIFEKQLGQHSGSQYETLSIVMRICIDQFKQQSPKTILFCLRDANPSYTDEGECRRKVQQDVLKIWKNVWTGTKKSVDFQKYQATPERFFSLQVAFLREYDPDYPEDFQEDVAKLRERFINPEVEGYLFKKQKKEYNLPIEDVGALLGAIWVKLTTSKELNLPNQKVQLANYRCEEYSAQLTEAFEKELEQNKGEIRNYQAIMDDLKLQFEEKTKNYSKQISEKFCVSLLEKFKPKIRIIINELIQHTQKQLEEVEFVDAIDNLFFDLEHPTDSFKQQAGQVKHDHVEKLANIYRTLNYEIPDRKERIENFANRLEKRIADDVTRRLKELHKEFEDSIERDMRLLVAKALTSTFGLNFYSEVTKLYSQKKAELLNSYNKQLIWARGTGGTANELDDAELNMVETLKTETKKALETGMLEKLCDYFRENFYYDQHKVKYDYNSLNDQKAIEIFSEAKEMVFSLIHYLNDFRLEPERRSSMILDDFETEQTAKPLLESNSILAIQEHFEKKAADQYAAVVRKRNQAHMKQVPTYLFVLIFYFIYDDIWFSYEEYPILHTLLIVLFSCIGLLYAVGQGPILRQIVEILYERLLGLLALGKNKVQELRAKKEE